MALTDAQRTELVQAALDVRANAYCPYSNFAVGAALLDTSGGIHRGVNVENASYPVGVCAERSAICNAITAGATEFVAVALVTQVPHPIAPCGMCRQALSEFGDLVVLMATPDGAFEETVISELLPAQFDPSHLDA